MRLYSTTNCTSTRILFSAEGPCTAYAVFFLVIGEGRRVMGCMPTITPQRDREGNGLNASRNWSLISKWSRRSQRRTHIRCFIPHGVKQKGHLIERQHGTVHGVVAGYPDGVRVRLPVPVMLFHPFPRVVILRSRRPQGWSKGSKWPLTSCSCEVIPPSGSGFRRC